MIGSLITLVIYIAIVALIIGLLLYALGELSRYIAAPFYQVLRVLIIIIGVLIVILLLLQFLGVVAPLPPRLVP